jgi:hypothetical protein
MVEVQGSYPVPTLYTSTSGRTHAGHVAPAGGRTAWARSEEPALQPALVPVAVGVP